MRWKIHHSLGTAAALLAALLCPLEAPDKVEAAALWPEATPESQGMSSEKLEVLRAGLEQRRTKALLLIRNDKIVHEWYADEHAPDKKHYTASAAKALVGGVSLALAMSDGRLGLDDPASKYVPQWKDAPERAKITVRQLGSHTSGLADSRSGSDLPDTGWKAIFWERRDPPYDPFTVSRDHTPLLFAPGTDYQYSNPGIAMLGYVVTAVLGDAPQKDLRTLLRDRVMRPIGVPDSDWSVGYGQTFEVEGLPLVGTWGGGGYTARAAARVARLMLREGDWDGTRLINAEAVRQTTADAGLPNGNAMGWFTNGRNHHESLPRDAYWASGAQHQTVLVVPSLSLICVRNGGDLRDTGDEDYRDARGPHFFDPLMDAIIE